LRKVVFAILLAWAILPSSVVAAPARQQTDAISQIDADMDSYGEWLGRISEIEGPVNEALEGLGARWQEAIRNGDPETATERFRPVIARIVADLDRADAQLDAMNTPEFESLELDSDLTTVALLQQYKDLNRQFRGVIGNLTSLFDGLQGRDEAAIRNSTRQVLESVRLMLESQALIARAGLEATPRDDSAWDVQNINLMYLRSTARLISAWPDDLVSRIDNSLGADLRNFATELEQSVAAGSSKLNRELQEYSDELEDAEREHDAARASVFRRVIALAQISREMLAIGRDMAAHLQVQAATFGGGQVSYVALVEALQSMRTLRGRMAVLDQRVGAALSEAGT